MRKAMIGIVSLGVAAACTALAGWSGAGTAEAGVESTLKAQCVQGFSKDGCDGKLGGGDVFEVQCPDLDCTTLYGLGATYETMIGSSEGVCGLFCEQPCDQSPKFSGLLTVTLDYMLDLKDCCPYRGCWEGSWTLETEDGRVFTGEAFGTVGVGTNRKSACPRLTDACERCYDVQNTEVSWNLGFEGAFSGYDEQGNSLCFTTDGTWFVGKTDDGRPNFKESFPVQSRFDGSALLICQ